MFDAVKSAVARGSDVPIIDTAGRLHTKSPLMHELQKIGRGWWKAGASVAETLLVLDATTGRMDRPGQSVHRGRGSLRIVLTKLDGTAKGGSCWRFMRSRRAGAARGHR